MQGYRRGSHTVYDIEYHFVWVTKYRYHVLTGEVARRIRQLVRQTCLALDVRIVKGHVSKDHVHILASCPLTLSPAVLMKRIKGRSSRKVQQEFDHLRKRYWGQHFWARGYFCATVGRLSEEQIRAYIERQLTSNATIRSLQIKTLRLRNELQPALRRSCKPTDFQSVVV